jgi:hypothetical protein
MAGPTDVLTEDVEDWRESNRQLTEEIKRVFERLSAETRESNHRLADAINRIAGDLGNLRVEIAKDLGAINTNLESFKGRTETSLSVARWVVAVSVPILPGLVIWSYSAYERAIHIEDSVTALKDHAKEQDARIAKLLELHDPNKSKSPSPVP